MLPSTKDQLQTIVNKLQVLDYTLQSLNSTHVEHKEKAETLFKRISTHQLKLVDEVARLSGADEAVSL